MTPAKKKTSKKEPIGRGDPDVELMLRFQEGDEEAFEQLVKRNVNTVHALVYRFLREPSQLDDITQEVFLRIYRNAHRYEPTAKFSTWLYRIVANICFNVMRKRKRSRTISLDNAGSPDESITQTLEDETQPAPDEDMRQDDLRRQVAAAVAELPENQRVAIVLNKYENKSYDEIAAIMDTTTMAVKSLLSRARSTLREKLTRQLESMTE
jgi:RNA polymerase sigma-70 factor (ECF subfamily)